MVIGEDLGTVPVEIVSKLREGGVYSYKVLYFERDEENNFRAPQSYPVQAMATITTHDLPTLRGYWQSDDLALGKTLGLYRDDEVLEGAVRRPRPCASGAARRAASLRLHPEENRA